MISESQGFSRDFSGELPMVIKKIEIISDRIQADQDHIKRDDGFYWAIGNMLDDTIKDLRTISEVLYGK